MNPGDHKTPTEYYSFGERSVVSVGQRVEVSRYTSEPSVSRGDSLCYTYGPGLAWNPSPVDPWNLPGTTGSADGLRGIAENSMIQAVLDAKQSDFNAGVFLAEAGKSAEMIANSATRIYRAMRSLRKGDLKGMYRALGDEPRRSRVAPKAVSSNASNYWLEAKYGWLPLLSDAKSAAEKLAGLVIEREPIFKVLGSASETRHSSDDYPHPYAAIKRTSTEVVACRCGISYCYGSSAIAQASSLGLTNPMLIAWETIPLSFVVDWFLPIGNFLEGLSAFHGLEFRSGFLTFFRKDDTIVISSPYKVDEDPGLLPDGSYGFRRTVSDSGSSYRIFSYGMTRGKYLDFPFPNFPKFRRSPLSLTKAVTALALLRQRV